MWPNSKLAEHNVLSLYFTAMHNFKKKINTRNYRKKSTLLVSEEGPSLVQSLHNATGRMVTRSAEHHEIDCGAPVDKEMIISEIIFLL